MNILRSKGVFLPSAISCQSFFLIVHRDFYSSVHLLSLLYFMYSCQLPKKRVSYLDNSVLFFLVHKNFLVEHQFTGLYCVLTSVRLDPM